MAQPMLPTRFPCWVKAVYSWGGEGKRDLGFVEGDLIECLNAGDGSWWMGRLKRDKRMVGLFPSNFVQVLDESFQPSTANSSSISTPNARNATSRTSTPASSGPSTPSPQKKTMFRKPFSGYGADSVTTSPVGSVSNSNKQKPFSSMKDRGQATSTLAYASSHPPSPTIPSPIARGSSPYDRSSRPVSPGPQSSYSSRNAPAQPNGDYESSSPPPPPPAHRVLYQQSEDRSSLTYNNDKHGQQYSNSRLPTPEPRSPVHTGMTPSPLRDAMNDVMTSLDDMSVNDRDHQPTLQTPPNIWSPDTFDEIYQSARQNERPHSSMELYGAGQREHESSSRASQNGPYPRMPIREDPPQLKSYVQRMESRLKDMHQQDGTLGCFESNPSSCGPTPPRKNSPFTVRPSTSHDHRPRPGSSYDNSSRPASPNNQVGSTWGRLGSKRALKHRKSAYELGRQTLERTFTTKSSVTSASSTAQSTSTNNSNSTQLTSQSIMSGHSAGGFSATSAGSLARRGFEPHMKGRPFSSMNTTRPAAFSSGTSNCSSGPERRPEIGPRNDSDNSIRSQNIGLLGGLTSPAPKKTSFFKKMLDTAKTSAATARSNFGSHSGSRPSSRAGPLSRNGDGASSVSGGLASSVYGPASDMGLSGGPKAGGTIDWVQMRRDVNRSNSLSRNERTDRADRCEMMDIPVIAPSQILLESTNGDEGADGEPVPDPTNFTAATNLALVDKSARFVRDLPATINPISLSQGYLCRPYRSEIQKLRAIFTWVSERIAWEDVLDGDEIHVDTRQMLHSKRGTSEDIACLVAEMVKAIGIQAEVVRGHLKRPGADLQLRDLAEIASRPNHSWNAVVCEGQWRIMDCALASPTNPNRRAYSTCAGKDKAEDWWFLARPMEACWTHVPLQIEQTHLCTEVDQEVLMALPAACPAFFRNSLSLWDFDTSLLHLDGLEMSHIQLTVPEGVELLAEVEARAFHRDLDGDYFESGDIVKKKALAQAEFISPTTEYGEGSATKLYTVKAVLPTADCQGTLKIYAGRRGLTHSINSNPHQLALCLPLHQQGTNPEFDFFARHPTPHALRNELYVANPQCKRLAVNNTFVFQVRQHPGSPGIDQNGGALARLGSTSSSGRAGSAMSMTRPSSALSMLSATYSSSEYSGSMMSRSNSSDTAHAAARQQEKPAKLAIQSPSGKVLRMRRKPEACGSLGRGHDGVDKLGSSWETIIKIGERGVWRGLVLADRSARWCVFGEWECW